MAISHDPLLEPPVGHASSVYVACMCCTRRQVASDIATLLKWAVVERSKVKDTTWTFRESSATYSWAISGRAASYKTQKGWALINAVKSAPMCIRSSRRARNRCRRRYVQEGTVDPTAPLSLQMTFCTVNLKSNVSRAPLCVTGPPHFVCTAGQLLLIRKLDRLKDLRC